jgi:hypothetical protein
MSFVIALAGMLVIVMSCSMISAPAPGVGAANHHSDSITRFEQNTGSGDKCQQQRPHRSRFSACCQSD